MDIIIYLQVFIAISLILGDGLYNLVKIIALTIKDLFKINTTKAHLPVVTEMLGKNDNIQQVELVSFKGYHLS